jgi:ectoine hydroxylase-related dioxygenase (phytanoyl-CoA dioxygenase family)
VSVGSFDAAMAELGVASAALTAEERSSLDKDGYVVLRNVFTADDCALFADAFERNYVPSHLSTPPRSHGSRHALLNHEVEVCRRCLAPRVLAGVHHVLRERFYLYDVQGRDPLPGHGYQNLHRDWVAPAGPAPQVIVLAFIDAFSPANGATRVIPGSHLLGGGADAFQSAGVLHPDQIVLEGCAGDVLVMAGYLAHSATRNETKEMRRNLQIDFRRRDFYAPRADGPRSDGQPTAIQWMLGEDP